MVEGDRKGGIDSWNLGRAKGERRIGKVVDIRYQKIVSRD